MPVIVEVFGWKLWVQISPGMPDNFHRTFFALRKHLSRCDSVCIETIAARQAAHKSEKVFRFCGQTSLAVFSAKEPFAQTPIAHQTTKKEEQALIMIICSGESFKASNGNAVWVICCKVREHSKGDASSQQHSVIVKQSFENKALKQADSGKHANSQGGEMVSSRDSH